MVYDSVRLGARWAEDGPQAGYFPFYLSILLAGAAIYGLVKEILARRQEDEVFVTREQFRRVLQVFLPTLAFCLVTEWLGLYVASFLLVAGFMMYVGKIAAWKSLLTAALFVVAMFATFDVAFDVIMPKGPLEALIGR